MTAAPYFLYCDLDFARIDLDLHLLSDRADSHIFEHCTVGRVRVTKQLVKPRTSHHALKHKMIMTNMFRKKLVGALFFTVSREVLSAFLSC